MAFNYDNPQVLELTATEAQSRFPHYQHGSVIPKAERREYWRDAVRSGDLDPDRVADALWVIEAIGGRGWVNTLLDAQEAASACMSAEGAAYGLAAREAPEGGFDANMDSWVKAAKGFLDASHPATKEVN